MKAKIKVKETGEILDFAPNSLVCGLRKNEDVEFAIKDVCIIPESTESVDWAALRHQYAGMAMQSILSSSAWLDKIEKLTTKSEDLFPTIAVLATQQAEALVRILKKN